jgi:uncharacterized protein (TIGR02453 family)
MPHAHFSPDLFVFLKQLKRNNNREWFERNKTRYLSAVRDPFLRFLEDLAPRMKKVSPHIVVDPRPVGGSLFRIYRDVRFSSDKRPYKTHAAAQFRHREGRDVHAPGFYVSLEPGEVVFGAGVWQPDGPALFRIRTAIAQEPARWTSIHRRASFARQWTPGGESLSGNPRGFDPKHPLIEELRRTDFVVFKTLGERDACRPGFLDEFVAASRAASPYMAFLTEAVGVEW